MKKLIFIFLAVAFLLTACQKEGDIVNRSERHIVINGREYKFLAIVPADNSSPVWILVPLDASVEVPAVTQYHAGKQNLTVIKVE